MVTIVLVTGSGPKCPRKPYYTLLISTSSKLSITHCNSKTFHILQNILQNIPFFTNFSQVTFLKKIVIPPVLLLK